MTTDFGIILKNGFELYKGVIKGNLLNKLKSACWFALSSDVADRYAIEYSKSSDSEVYELILNKDIKLINILDLKFKLDFWDRCNKYYKNTDIDKARALIALGIPNIETQKLLIPNNNIDNCDNIIKSFGNLLGGHRCSSPDIDLEMVRAMIEFYGDKYNGYIQEFDVPTCYHGSNFSAEICIFKCDSYLDLNNIKLLKSFSKIKPGGKLKGGNYEIIVDNNIIARENVTLDDWKRVSKNHIKALRYEGAIKYDENGIASLAEPISYEKVLDQRFKELKERNNAYKLKIGGKKSR